MSKEKERRRIEVMLGFKEKVAFRLLQQTRSPPLSISYAVALPSTRLSAAHLLASITATSRFRLNLSLMRRYSPPQASTIDLLLTAKSASTRDSIFAVSSFMDRPSPFPFRHFRSRPLNSSILILITSIIFASLQTVRPSH
ncbi:hypothetical protein RYX36_011787 [Vicia faba]